MTCFDIVNDLLCLACCLRLILFTRGSANHRPWASMLAYALIVAFATMAILPWLDQSLGFNLAQSLLNAVLTAAVFAAGGNVVELFRPRGNQSTSALLRVLKRKTWI